MATTSSPSQVPTTSPNRGRLFAVVLVAAWVGAFAVTSAPATDAQSMTKADPTCTLVYADPLHPGSGEWIC